MSRPLSKARHEQFPSDSAVPTRRTIRLGKLPHHRSVGPQFAPLGPALRGEVATDVATREAPPKVPRARWSARVCPASRSILIRTAALLVLASGVILVLPPLASGDGPALQTSFLGIISPNGDVHREPRAITTRHLPQAQPVMHEGRLAALTGPTYTASVASATSTPAPVTVKAVDLRPLAFAGQPNRPMPSPFADVAPPGQLSDTASAPSLPAVPMPRPDDLLHGEAAAAPNGDNAAGDTSTTALVTHARQLIARGKLAEGRAALKQAVAGGSSHAATILAKTYDPAVLKSWHVKGARVDPAEARQWYERAKELGAPRAEDALARLQ